nr:RNA-directed DNA polymerase, eukaryota [Tanacetum cinerariifolium]
MGLPSGYWWGEDNGLRWDCLAAAGGGRVWGRVLQVFGARLVCLDRHLSDHRPIILREVNVDFGPIPF